MRSEADEGGKVITGKERKKIVVDGHSFYGNNAEEDNR